MDRPKAAVILMLIAGLGLAITGVLLTFAYKPAQDPNAGPDLQALPTDGAELEAEGARLVADHNCNFCHRTSRPDKHPEIRDNCQQCHQFENRPENLAPPLVHIAERRPESWLRRFLRYPYKLREHSADRMPDLGLTDREVEVLTRYLLQLAGPRNAQLPAPRIGRDDSPSSDKLAQGKQLWDQFNCNQCHSLGAQRSELVRNADGALTNPAAIFAPDLTLAWTRVKPQFAQAAILEPEKWLPWSGMPKQNITVDQADLLAWYVFNAVPEPRRTVDYQRVLGILSARCNGCHYGPQQNAPESTNPQGGAGWLATWSKHPRKLDLMSLAGLMRGATDDLGRPRPTVVPYAENSPLLMHLKGLKQPVMPFGGDPLPPDEIADIETWVLSGAPLPKKVGGIEVAPPIEMGNGK